MNRQELLQEFYDLTEHNLLCYSKNYLMTIPKVGYEKNWEDEKEKLEIIKEMIEEERENRMSFTQEQILKMYPNTQYYVRNSNGGLLAGTTEIEDAKKYAEQYKQEYLNDSLNNHLGVFVYDKNGNNVYVAKGIQKNLETEETEEFE